MSCQRLIAGSPAVAQAMDHELLAAPGPSRCCVNKPTVTVEMSIVDTRKPHDFRNFRNLNYTL